MLNPLSAVSSILPPKASVYSLTALSRSGDELYFLSFVSALSAEKPACCLGGAAGDKWEVFLDKCCAQEIVRLRPRDFIGFFHLSLTSSFYLIESF